MYEIRPCGEGALCNLSAYELVPESDLITIDVSPRPLGLSSVIQ